MKEKATALSVQAFSILLCDAEILAWESTEDDVDSREHVSSQGCDIVPDWSGINFT
jgi:hypothetical protein